MSLSSSLFALVLQICLPLNFPGDLKELNGTLQKMKEFEMEGYYQSITIQTVIKKILTSLSEH